MSLRFYFVPSEDVAPIYHGPKYFKWGRAGQSSGSLPLIDSFDYGNQGVFLVAADLAQVDHDALVLNADVIAMPLDIDSTVLGGERNDLRTSFEDFTIPATWIETGATYRSILKRLTGMFFVLNCFQGHSPTGYIFLPANLNASYSTLPELSKSIVNVCAAIHNWDTSGYNDNSNIRVMLAALGDQQSPSLAGVIF